MNNETNSSPLQRLGAFFLGLLTFVGFGILAWIVFHFTGGDTDSNYEMKSAARAEKIKEISTAQESGIIPSASDLDNYVVANQNNSPKTSKKPVPGTKPFEEWMKAQAAASQVPKTDPEPKSEPEKKLVEITINALGNPPGTMKFKETEVEVAAGSNVVLTFMNPDVLQHNLVLVNQKKTGVVGALADAMLTDPEALKKHYVPKSDDIIASTKLVNPGGSEKIEFIAPSEPGDYPFICTFPGHWRLMQGKIKVTASNQSAKTKLQPDPKSELEEKPEKKLVEITINALGNPPGTMKFKETEVEVAAGSNVVLTFMNPDVLQHNLVLVNQKKTGVVGALADAMLTDPEALKKHYVPKSDDIIASTKLVNPGGSEKIEFIAPSEPGDYPFICTFPGHWRLMQGKIKVTK